MMKSNPVCVIPTRGLIYAETIKGMIPNIIDCNAGLVIVTNEGMPNCFNKGVQEALDIGATHIWFLEEDNEAPLGILRKMIEMDKPIVTLDYNVGQGVSHIQRNEQGEPLWCGLGCTLIKREVFEALQQPYFEVNEVLNLNTNEWSEIPEHAIDKKYGGHDVNFFYKKLKPLGIEITVMENMKGEHYYAEELPKREMNKGYYTIKSR